MIDEDVSLNEAEKTRLKQRFSWATSVLRSGGGVSHAEEGLTLDSSLFLSLVAIEQRLGIPPAQVLRYLLVELEEENRYPDERWQIMDFARDENNRARGTFSRDLGTFYRDNFDSIQAQFPEITLCPDDYVNVRLLPIPVLEETIRQFVGAE